MIRTRTLIESTVLAIAFGLVFWVIALSVAGPVRGANASCATIKDQTLAALCRAKDNPIYCLRIENPDLRKLCQAEKRK